MNLNFLRGPSNLSLDLMRLGGAFVIFGAYPFPFLWNAIEHGSTPDPAAYGTGWAAVIIAVGGAICAKDIGVAKANAAGNEQ
jgi:hypothetical protein